MTELEFAPFQLLDMGTRWVVIKWLAADRRFVIFGHFDSLALAAEAADALNKAERS